MNITKFLAGSAAIVLLVISPVASAKDRVDFTEGQATSLPAFDSLALKSGGTVTIRPAADYTVTVLEGGKKVEVFMDGNSLQIGCRKPCRGNVRRVIEVTAPGMENVAIAGGGSITFESGFSEQGELNVAVVGGGSINALSISARSVNAAVTGGGSIKVTATETLDAAVVGGGSIAYDGDPEVNKSTIGGGSVSRR